LKVTNLVVYPLVILVDDAGLRIFEIKQKYLVITITNYKSLVFVKLYFLNEAQVHIVVWLSLERDIILGLVQRILHPSELGDQICYIFTINFAYFECLSLYQINGEEVSIWMKLNECFIGFESHLIHLPHGGVRSDEHPQHQDIMEPF
jgi:hypothetical protein